MRMTMFHVVWYDDDYTHDNDDNRDNYDNHDYDGDDNDDDEDDGSNWQNVDWCNSELHFSCRENFKLDRRLDNESESDRK